MERACPPNKLSRSVVCDKGVQQLSSDKFRAFVMLKRQPDGTVSEHLGLHTLPWLAGVVHDVAACKLAYDEGSLSSLRQGSDGGGRGGSSIEALNFPLSSFASQEVFWECMEQKSFGKLVVQLQHDRRLVKSLFFGDTWAEGLAEERRKELEQRKGQPLRAHSTRSASKEREPQQELQQRHERHAVQLAAEARENQEEPRPASKRRRLSPAAESKQPEEEQPPPPPPGPPAASGGTDGRSLSTSPAAPSVATPREQRANDAQQREQAAAAREASATRAGNKPADEGPSQAAAPVAEAPHAAPSHVPPPAAAAAQPAGAGAGSGSAPQQRPGLAGEPANVWISPDAEFPKGSGHYPMYLKQGPIEKHYYTVSKSASAALFAPNYEGEVQLRHHQSGQTWTVHTNLKGGTQRYLTKIGTFNRENGIQAHDVLWFKPHSGVQGGDGPQQPACMLFGVWPWGSQEAAAFTAKLTAGKSPAKQHPAKAASSSVAKGSVAGKAASAQAAPAAGRQDAAQVQATRELLEDSSDDD